MRFSKIFRSIVSLCVTVAMLVGMLAVFGALPAAAAKSVEKFTANFSALPSGEVSLTDTATVKYLEDRFAFYYFQEEWYMERADVNGYVLDADGNYLTEATDGLSYHPDIVDKKAGAGNSEFVDGTGTSAQNKGISRWAATKKYLYATAYSAVDAKVFRKANTMWVKANDGDLAVLKNFSLEMDFQPANTKQYSSIGANTDGIGVFFRAKTAGQVYGPADQTMVHMAPDGGLFVGKMENNFDASAYAETMQYDGKAVTFDRTKDYHLTLTVVGTEMTLSVQDNATDQVVYELIRTVDDLPAGYLGIGGSNAGAYYANIEITRLDKDGNPLDFNDHDDGYGFGADFARIADYRQGLTKNAGNSWDWHANGTYLRDNGANLKWLDVVELDSNTYDFSAPDTYAADAKVADYLDEKFDFYYNRENVYTQFAAPYENSVTQDPDEKYPTRTAQWKLQDGRYLNAVFGKTGGETFRKVLSIVPKTDDGEQAMMKNFETEFDMQLTATANTGLAVSFRAEVAGKLTSAYKTSVSNKITVVFTSAGYKVYTGKVPTAECVTPVVNAWADNATVTKAHVYMQAVGDTITMKITGDDGTLYYAGSTQTSYEADGTVFYSVLNGTGGFANIRINRLHDDGSVAPWNTPSSLNVSFDGYANENPLDTTGEAYAKVTKNFHAYYDVDGTLTQTYFQKIDSIGTFSVLYSRAIQCVAPVASKKTALQYVSTLVPKTADGKEAVLKNFELSFATRWAEINQNNNGVGGIVIGFRQKTSGKITTGAGNVNTEQGLIVITPTGISIAGGKDITDAMYSTANGQTFDTELNAVADSNNAYYNVKVRVVDSQVTVTIGDNTYTGIVNYDEAGYLAFGVGGYYSQFRNITVTRLDDDGNVMDWNAQQYESIPTTVSLSATHLLGLNTTYENKYPNNNSTVTYSDDSISVVQRAEFIETLDAAFDVYYNDYDGTNATYIHNASVVGNTAGYNYAKLTYNKNKVLAFMQCAAISGYGSLKTNDLRQVGSLVPKDADGEQLLLKNFSLTTSYVFHNNSSHNGYGAVVIGFRQAEPGRYFTATGEAATGDYVMITSTGLSVYEDGVLKEQAAYETGGGAGYNIDLQVVGTQLTYKVYWKTSTKASGTVELSTEKAGYLALSNTHYLRGFSSNYFSVTALDENGEETPIKQPASTAKNGSISVTTTADSDVYTNIITVTPDDGYELLAGSLVATDIAGNVYVPTRVGFRNGGDATQYVVQCTSPVKATATFYKPTTADPNIGNVGTSINEELAGLRFVSRLARTVDGDTEYVTFDGETFEVVDYGMLVAVKSVLGTDVLSLNTTETNPYIKQLSIKNNNVYYDVCDAYIDMSVCITHVDKVNGGTEMDVVARPYAVVKDANGEEVALYAQSFTSNYAENAGLATVTFSELEQDGKVEVLGRAGVVEDDLQIDWVNTGFEIKGTLMGAVKVNMTSARADSLLNVSVDGKEACVVHVPNGTSTVTLADNLSKGEHTIRVESGTSVRQGTLTANSLQYLGELADNGDDQSRLKIEVLGDSISCGWGLDGNSGNTYTTEEKIAISNSYYSYAAQTARLLDADLQVVAQCSKTITDINGYFPYLNKRSGSAKWDFENNQQDIVIINLGTNDEYKGADLSETAYSAENTLANAKELLADVRKAYPDAYIIYVYGMMRKTYETQYQQAINEMNDDKAFYVDMSEYKSTDGYDGNHPKRDSHTAVANALAAFIRTNCPELFEHTPQTETIGALETAQKVLLTDRTAASDTARTMTYSNTGITLEGYLYGELKMNVAVEKETCAINVIVDGDTINATTVWVEAGEKEVTLLSDLRRGYHTIEIVKGTAHHAGTLLMKDITYTGTLTTPTAKDLQMLFIGDSVTVGEGMYGNITPLAKSYNAIDGYAAQTARYLDAGVTTVAVCGAKIPAMTTQYKAQKDGAKDIVVINLGTNDFGYAADANLDITTDYYSSGNTDKKIKDAITGLIDQVRAKQPDAYIIWGYGMMFDQHLDALKGIITDYAEQTDDDKLLFCDLSAAKDNSGKSNHPSVSGNHNAALVLTGFIRENCADVLETVATPQKTFANHRALKVACVGDSITALGYWENNMRGELSADDFEVQGFGVSGATALFKGVDYEDANTNVGRAYIDQAAYSDALDYDADIVVIMLGTNDSKIVNWPYYADEFVDNYTEIVRSFQNSDSAPMVFIGLPPTVYSTEKWQDISNYRIENFIIPALYEVAARTGAIVVDTHTATSGDESLVIDGDGVHPSEAGKQVLCETFADAIHSAILASQTSATLNGVSLSQYTVVYAENASDYTVRAAEYVCEDIREKTGVELYAVTDAVSAGENEIVIGETNRAISQTLDADTEGVEFVLLADGGSVAMEGDYFVIAAAAYYFSETYIVDNDAATAVPTTETVCTPIVEEANNYILLIGDGMGVYQTELFNVLSATTLTDYSDGENFFYGNMFPYQGYARTNSLSGVTDSAAAGTALSTGSKTKNSRVAVDENGNDLLSITELAGSIGKATAVMSTEPATGATPSAFSAHALKRQYKDEIAIEQSALVQQYGTIINCDYDCYDAAGVNQIVNNIRATLDELSGDKDGFFLMYEEAHIDKHCHNMDMENTFMALVRFDRAIATFMEYAFYNPDTVVLITADHETGDMKKDGDTYVYQQGDHSGQDVPVLAYGKGMEVFDGIAVENVQIPKTFASMMGQILFSDNDAQYPSLIQ